MLVKAYIESVTSAHTANVHFLGFGTKQELPPSSLRPIALSPDQHEPFEASAIADSAPPEEA